jgi:DNA mismatch endonuclease (patch repair protein)
MAAIKGRDTRCEMAFARLLRKEKIRYRRATNHLPGKPDFILMDARVAIFVDGDFWHGRFFQSWKQKLSIYWLKKISGNRRRDRRVGTQLRRIGFQVVRIWESDLQKRPPQAIAKIRSKM